ncbi:MAG TPA: SMC-Scp complex subunit ScpB [archaeon]|nr:SMC-Scp complex subunit ScpB [archaeon]
MAEAKKVIEAALFMSPQAISFNELVSLAGGVLELRDALNELMKEYSERDSSLEIIESAGGFQMRVKDSYYSKVKNFAASSNLSQSYLRTLALIAYKQPIKQATVIKYRSNKAYDDIKVLEEMGFISREKNERTFILRTTKKFVKYFGDNPIRLEPYEEPVASQ